MTMKTLIDSGWLAFAAVMLYPMLSLIVFRPRVSKRVFRWTVISGMVLGGLVSTSIALAGLGLLRAVVEGLLFAVMWPAGLLVLVGMCQAWIRAIAEDRQVS